MGVSLTTRRGSLDCSVIVIGELELITGPFQNFLKLRQECLPLGACASRTAHRLRLEGVEPSLGPSQNLQGSKGESTDCQLLSYSVLTSGTSPGSKFLRFQVHPMKISELWLLEIQSSSDGRKWHFSVSLSFFKKKKEWALIIHHAQQQNFGEEMIALS